MPKNPMVLDQVIFNPNNTVDPLADGGLTYVNGTGFRMKVGATTYTIPTSSSATAKLNAITDPDGSATLAMGVHTNTWASTAAAWGGSILKNSHANPTAGASLLNLQYNANGDADGLFILCKDNAYADAQFTVGANGAIITEGDFTLATNKFTVKAATGNTIVGGTLDATGDLKVNTTSLTVAAATGNTAILGDLAINTAIFTVNATTGAVSITGAGTVALGVDNKKLALGNAGATDSYLYFSGVDLCFYDSNYGGEVTLSQLTAIAPDPTIAGNLTITDGKLDWADAVDEVAGTWSFANTAVNDIAWTSLATSGNCLSMTANNLTTGSMIYLESSAAGMAGEYIRCWDGAADDFVVGADGRVTIAGASAIDAVTVSAGHVQVTDGDVDIDQGKITVDSTSDEGSNVTRNFNGVGTAAVLTVKSTHASSTKEALFVDADGTGASQAVVIDHEGTGDCVTITSKAAAGSLIKATGEAATGTILEAISAASATVSAITLTNTGTAATGWLGADGVGMLHLTCDGNLAHANASCLSITYSGAGAATGLGTSLRIVDTGATATSYAAYISAATGEALFIDSGNVRIDETLQMGAADGTGADVFVYSGAAGAYVHADTSEHEFRLAGTEILCIGGTGAAKDGLTIDFDGADIDIDAVTANDNIKFGSDIDTNVIFATAASTLTIDHGTNSVILAAGGYAKFIGSGTGKGLMIPIHASASPNEQDEAGAGNIFFEVDADKLWIYNGTAWKGVTIA